MSLLLKDLCGRLCGIECAVQVDVHDLAPLLGGIILSRDGGCDARVDNDDIESPKVFLDLGNCALDLVLVGHVGLVCARGDLVRRCDFGGRRVGCVGSVVDYSYLGLLVSQYKK